MRDANGWHESQVAVADRGYLSCWADGLPENGDRNNVRVYLGDTRLHVSWMGARDAAGYRQINTEVPGTVEKGQSPLRIECGGVSSDPVAVARVL